MKDSDSSEVKQLTRLHLGLFCPARRPLYQACDLKEIRVLVNGGLKAENLQMYTRKEKPARPLNYKQTFMQYGPIINPCSTCSLWHKASFCRATWPSQGSV